MAYARKYVQMQKPGFEFILLPVLDNLLALAAIFTFYLLQSMVKEAKRLSAKEFETPKKQITYELI